LTNENHDDKISKDKTLKRLQELAEKSSATEVLDRNLSEEEQQWFSQKMPNDPFQNIQKDLEITQSERPKSSSKKLIPIPKYSFNGKGNLHEAVIINGKPYFATFSDGKINIVEKIEENTRILRPPEEEEYSYKPYEFTSKEELQEFISKALCTSKDELYNISKLFFNTYADQDEHVLNLLAMDSIWTYFQDLFPTTHYVECVGTNDVGKSTIGYIFEYTGYRAIKATSISGANYYRMLGSIEPGQCIIIEDEGDNISDDPDKIRILKNGYEYTGKVPKINMNTYEQKQIWYKPYCFKMILAEKSMSQWKARGLVDRTFTLNCRPGHVRYSIKEVITDTINKDPNLQKLSDELMDFRKLMICYRLVNYRNTLPNIETGLKNRYNELCKPLLQLFWGTDAFSEVIKTLGIFIDQRKNRIENSIEAVVYPIIENAVSKLGNEISVRVIWEFITDSLEGYFDINKDGIKIRPTLFHSEDYGDLHMKVMTSMICDKLGAKLKHRNNGNVLVFDSHYLAKIGKAYNRFEGIQTRLTMMDSSNEFEKSQQYNSKSHNNDSSDSSDSISDWDERNNTDRRIDEFSAPAQKVRSFHADTSATKSLIESPESLQSLHPEDLELPFVETLSEIKLYRCPRYKEGCKFRNIHPDEIRHHFRFKHLQDETSIENTSVSYLSNIVYEQSILLNSVIPRTTK
jgi:hypothetical protein